MDLQIFLFISCWSLVSAQAIVQKTFCWNEDFRLSCKWKNILAIHDAYFTNDLIEVNTSKCQDFETEKDPLCTEDVKTSVNKRCSGMSHCRYNLTEDHRQRQCYCKGIIVLRYACVPESDVIQSCNSKVLGERGYISSPGYPRFYPKVQHCTWNIEESKNQKMVLNFLDMDTRPPTRKKGVMDNCPDSLTVFEDNHKLRNTCGAYNNDTRKPLFTSGKALHLDFSSLDFMPSRGFLLHFKVHGCPTLPPPEHGYMVYRNESAALYMCCRDHVFINSTKNMVLLQCVDNMRWNGSVPVCISPDDEEILSRNRSMREDVKVDIVQMYHKRNKYIEEILIPTACVVGLVFGHAAAIIVALKFRKKRKPGVAIRQSIIAQQNYPHQVSTRTSLPPSTAQISSPEKVPMPLPPTPPKVPIAPRVLITDV